MTTKITCAGRYLLDFGMGTTDDPKKAHNYTADEAHALTELYPDYSTETRALPERLAAKTPPAIPAGEGCVWVRYKGTWLAASRQELFIATRKALEPEQQQEVVW